MITLRLALQGDCTDMILLAFTAHLQRQMHQLHQFKVTAP